MTVKITKPEINIREKLTELHKPSGVAGEAMLRAETPQEQFNLIGAGRKNLFINGAFEVFQRGAGPASPSSGNSPSTADRWNIPNTSEVSEVVANDRASHLSKMLKVTANSSGYGQVAQWIENVRTAAGQNVTVSCWVKSPTAGPMRFHIYQAFGSGGSSTVSVIDDASYFTINKADVWQRFEATIYIPSVDGKTIGDNSYLAIQMGAPSSIANRIVYYSEMQAELGKVATPFEHRSYGEELALCQRYYERIDGTQAWDQAVGFGDKIYIPIKFHTQKRDGSAVSVEYSTTSPSTWGLFYGTATTSAAIANLITGWGTATSDAHHSVQIVNLSADTYTPRGTAALYGIKAGQWIAFESEI